MANNDQSPLLEREIPIERVHPDPFQPRLEPDAELSESIRSQGILQAIRVEPIQQLDAERICDHCGRTFMELHAESGHFMIQDGERRYRGALAAKLRTVLAKVVEPKSEGKRLVTQLTTNTGKPLTPIEEAFAFKRIMESEGWSQNELAKQLGRPRSLIGDRIRLAELHPAWIALIQNGTLQPSHAALISPYSNVPDDYQVKAAATIAADYRITNHIKAGEPVPSDEFKHALWPAFSDYVKRLDEVRGYKGPVCELEDRYSYPRKKVKYAADIALWRPIWNKHQREAKKRQKASGGLSRGNNVTKQAKAIIALPIEERQSGEYYAKANAGELLVYSHQGWADGIDPVTFLTLVDRAKLTRVVARYEPGVVTTDTAAFSAAKVAYDEGYKKAVAPVLKKLRDHFAALDDTYKVTGPGLRALLHVAASEWHIRQDLPKVCAALDLSLPMGSEDDDESDMPKVPFPHLAGAEVEQLAAAVAAVLAGAVQVPDSHGLEQKFRSKFINLPFDLSTGTGKKRGRPSNAEKAARAAAEDVLMDSHDLAEESAEDLEQDELEEAAV